MYLIWLYLEKDFVQKEKTRFLASLFSGAKESRTPDLLHAMQALYQLSYNPERCTKYRIKNGRVKGNFEKKYKKRSLVISQWSLALEKGAEDPNCRTND